jgi:hypothetical protein
MGQRFHAIARALIVAAASRGHPQMLVQAFGAKAAVKPFDRGAIGWLSLSQLSSDSRRQHPGQAYDDPTRTKSTRMEKGCAFRLTVAYRSSISGKASYAPSLLAHQTECRT